MAVLRWSMLKGNTFEKKWNTLTRFCEEERFNVYDTLRTLIVNDPAAFKIDAGGMRPEHAAGPDAKEYEIVILLSAQYFTTVRPTPRGVPHDRRRFDHLDAAIADVGDTKRALIYGVCESGRAAVLSRDLWQAYSTIVAAVRQRDSQKKEG